MKDIREMSLRFKKERHQVKKYYAVAGQFLVLNLKLTWQINSTQLMTTVTNFEKNMRLVLQL